MTVEKQLKAIFNIPENVQATPVSMAIEYESMIQRLEIKQRHLKALYEKYLAEQAVEEAEHSGRTVAAVTRIDELGFSEKCTRALQKKNITKLSDLSEVSRSSLLADKTIGSENVARLDRIIAPLGIMFKYTEDYQSVGEDVIDDSSLEDTDSTLRSALSLSDKEVEERVQKRVAEEMEDFKANYEASKCDDCAYRREAEKGSDALDDTAKAVIPAEDVFSAVGEPEGKAEEAAMDAINSIVNDTAGPVSEIPVQEFHLMEEFEDDDVPESFDNPEEIDEKTRNLRQSILEAAKRGKEAETKAEEKSENMECSGNYIDFLEEERIMSSEDEVPEPMDVSSSEVNDVLAAFDSEPEPDTYGRGDANSPEAAAPDINQFLAGLEDEQDDEDDDLTEDSAPVSNTSEDAIFSQIADLIDIDGFEPTIENETSQPAARTEKDVDLAGIAPAAAYPNFTAMQNHNETTFVPGGGDDDIYTGLEEDVDVSMDDIFDDE